MITISMDIDDKVIAQLNRKLNAFERRADTATRSSNAAYKQMLEEAERAMIIGWRHNFNTQGRGRWPALDPDTVASKDGRGQPLVFTGKMRGKFFNMMYPNRGARSMSWNFRNYRGLLYHHFGTSHEPPRPLIDIDPSTRREIVDIVRRHARKFVSIAWQQG